MDGYLAKVRVLAVVDGERREFAPGEPLPDLDARDVEQLVAMQAIERDPNSSTSDAAPLTGGAERPAGSDQPEPAPEPQPAARRVRRTKE